MTMNIQFLGTGTSYGVPVIGCECPVCTSEDKRNRRRRAAVHVIAGSSHILIDTPPDLRESVLDHDIRQVNAVLMTHAHADHIFGFDDLRPFYRMNGEPMPVYGAPDMLATMRSIFGYVEMEVPEGTSVLRVDFRPVTRPFTFADVCIEPIPVSHGANTMFGYLLEYGGNRMAYIPDCSAIPEESLARLTNLDIMILDALRHSPHPTHFCLSESVTMLKRINAGRSFITHLCHDLEHQATSDLLPPTIGVAFDGESICLP